VRKWKGRRKDIRISATLLRELAAVGYIKVLIVGKYTNENGCYFLLVIIIIIKEFCGAL